MRLFILFIPLVLIFPSGAYSQNAKQLNDLPKEEKRIIKKKLKAMSAEDKALAFVLLKEIYFGDYKERVAGILTPGNNISKLDKPFASSEIVRIVNLVQVRYFNDVPFPIKATRENAGNKLPGWLPNILDAGYLADIDTFLSEALYYGMDSTGNYMSNTPYNSWDSLTSALTKHDLIYTPGNPEQLLSILGNLKFKSPQRKLLDDKLKAKLIHELEKKPRSTAIPSNKEMLKWIWQTYGLAINIKGAGSVLPIINLESINICTFSFYGSRYDNFSERLNRYTPTPSYNPTKSNDKDLARLAAYDLVIIPVAKPSVKENEFMQKLATKTSVLLVAFGDEPIYFDSAVNINFILVPEDNRLTQSLAAQIIFGADISEGSAKILKYGDAELVGLNPHILKLIDNVVKEAIRAQAIPGCQILVARDGMVVFDKAYGYQTYDSVYQVDNNTKYDLASITKVLSTTQGIMYLLEHDSIKLDEPLSNHLEYLVATNKKDISIREIMAHQAGLYPYYPFWKKAKSEIILAEGGSDLQVQVGKSLWVSSSVEDSILSWAASSDLLVDRIDTITHEQYIYSDIGFYLLKDLIERKTEQPLNEFLREQLYKPLGTSLVFNPLCFYPVTDLAPTEKDDLLRTEIVQGFVHDRNAALMGGVAGQAGLFGNANDVAIMLQLQLNGGYYGHRRYYKAATLEQFLSRHFDNNRRGLGWDMPGTEPDGPVSVLASDNTFGHTGFTGGSIWADPKENLIFVFLSNRVYPSVENSKLIDMNIRTRIQDIVYRAIE